MVVALIAGAEGCLGDGIFKMPKEKVSVAECESLGLDADAKVLEECAVTLVQAIEDDELRSSTFLILATRMVMPPNEPGPLLQKAAALALPQVVRSGDIERADTLMFVYEMADWPAKGQVFASGHPRRLVEVRYWARVIRGLESDGEVAGAIRIALGVLDKVEDPLDRVEGRLELAQSLARKGREEEGAELALEAVQALAEQGTPQQDRSADVVRIVKGLAATGNIEEATLLAGHIADTELRDQAYAGIAQGWEEVSADDVIALASKIEGLDQVVSSVLSGWVRQREFSVEGAKHVMGWLLERFEGEEDLVARLGALPTVHLALVSGNLEEEAAELADAYVGLWEEELTGKEREFLIFALLFLPGDSGCPQGQCGEAWEKELLAAWPEAIAARVEEEGLSAVRRGEEEMGLCATMWLWQKAESLTDNCMEAATRIESKDHRLAALGLLYFQVASSRLTDPRPPF